MKLRYLSLVALVFCLLSPVQAWGENQDSSSTVKLIGQFEKIFDGHKLKPQYGKRPDPEYAAALVANRKSALMRIIQTSGLKTLSKTHVDKLAKSIEASVDTMLRKALAMNSIGDAFKTVRQFTTDGFIMNTIASFMGIPLPTDTLLPSKLVSAQVVSRSGSLVISEAMVMSEIGALNAGNGIGEPGEWVEIGLMVTNGSRIPWYSTSVFPESLSPDCLWIRKGEIEPGEFLKKGAKKPSASGVLFLRPVRPPLRSESHF